MAHATTASTRPPTDCAPEHCPLCGGPNDCRLCTSAAYKGPCWCESAKIPDELLVRIPAEARDLACICRGCVASFHCEQSDTENRSRRREEADLSGRTNPPPHVGGYEGVVPGDFYFGADGLMVFTAAYHQRRGYCCDNDCRHCPYHPASQDVRR